MLRNKQNDIDMNSNKNIPQLRFPGFTGEWEEKKLVDVTNNEDNRRRPVSKTERKDGDYPYYGANGIQDFIDNYIFDGDYLLVGEDGSVLSSDNTPVINWASGKFWVNNHAHVLSQKGDNSLKYVSYILSSIKIPGLVTGIPPKLNQENLNNILLAIPPSLNEQQKIAECLSEIDNLIAAQGEKVDALREKKKGMMQQMFPKQGETTPRLRFPGFTGEWDYVDGDELFEAISNKNHNSDLPILALTQDQGAVPRDMINYNVIVSDKSVAGYKVVEVDDFIISLRSFQGGIEYSRYKGLCSPAYIVLRKKSKELCSDFYRIYFKSFNYIQDLNKNLEGIRDGKMISYKQFSEIKLPKPSPSEQQKIAECLSAMDDMIASESAKLDALKDHKKGLMQQLFPQPNK